MIGDIKSSVTDIVNSRTNDIVSLVFDRLPTKCQNCEYCDTLKMFHEKSLELLDIERNYRLHSKMFSLRDEKVKLENILSMLRLENKKCDTHENNRLKGWY